MDEYAELSDEQIIEKIKNIDQGLYAIIVSRYKDKLIRYANSIIKDTDKSVDIVQISLIKAYIDLKGFNTKKKFSSWMYRIVHNEALNLIKKYHKETPWIEDLDFSSDEDIEENFAQNEVVSMVGKCLKDIPLLYSEVLSLYYIEEKSHREISDILKIPMGTVAIRISRGKQIMKKICQKI